MATEKYAIDFDCSTTNIYKLGSGLVLSEPTVATASDNGKGEVKSIGLEASKVIGKTGKDTKIVFPVFEGEIVNKKVATSVLFGFMKKLGVKNKFAGVTALFALPSGATSEMLDAYREVAKGCGIGKVYFAESLMLSALGQRIHINDFAPCFVIDMGGGTTNIGALSLDGIIAGVSVNIGVSKINADIIDHVSENLGIQIGFLTADRLRREIGSLEEGDILSTVVNGRKIVDGTPSAFSVKAQDILEGVKKYYDKIAEIAIEVLKKLPPEVSAEIRHSGVYIAGAASKIYGLDKYFEQKLDIKVNIAENAQYSVALGGGIALGNSELLKRVIIKN